jgi:hypothetical protein
MRTLPSNGSTLLLVIYVTDYLPSRCLAMGICVILHLWAQYLKTHHILHIPEPSFSSSKRGYNACTEPSRYFKFPCTVFDICSCSLIWIHLRYDSTWIWQVSKMSVINWTRQTTPRTLRYGEWILFVILWTHLRFRPAIKLLRISCVVSWLCGTEPWLFGNFCDMSVMRICIHI